MIGTDSEQESDESSPVLPRAARSPSRKVIGIVAAISIALGVILILFALAPKIALRGGRIAQSMQLDGGCGVTCGLHADEALDQDWVQLLRKRSWNNASLLEAYLHASFSLDYNCSNPVRLPGPVVAGAISDGGYVVCDEPEVNWHKDKCTLLSFGIANDDTFEVSLAERYGCEVHEFDPTVDWAWGEYNPNVSVHFHKLGCWSHATNLSIGPVDSIENLVNKYLVDGNRLNLKIDVEGSEWETLPAIPDSILDQVDTLILEIHTTLAPPNPWQPTAHQFEPPTLKMVESLARIREKFYLFHWHVNNCCTPTPIGTDYGVPVWNTTGYNSTEVAAAAPGSIPIGHDLVVPHIIPNQPLPTGIPRGPAPDLPDGVHVPPGLAVPGPIELSFVRKALIPGTPEGPFDLREDLNGANLIGHPLISSDWFPYYGWNMSFDKNWDRYKQRPTKQGPLAWLPWAR